MGGRGGEDEAGARGRPCEGAVVGCKLVVDVVGPWGANLAAEREVRRWRVEEQEVLGQGKA